MTNVRRPAGDRPEAVAKLEAKSDSTVAGEAAFFVLADKVQVELRVTGTPPGTHAVHLHETGDCSSADGESAGPHWNPTGHQHGQLDKNPPAHLGDIGNLVVGSDGSGVLKFTTAQWTVGTGAQNDILGKGLIVHASEDDFTSQPAGNAGKRLACGVVRKLENENPAVSLR